MADPTRKPFYAPYHISLHGPICIWAIFDPLWPRVGSIYGHFGGKNRAIMTGWLQGNVSAWKLFYAPYHISLYGQTWLRAIFDLSTHPYGTGEVQSMAIMGVKTGRLWRACFRMRTPFYVPYHTSLHGQSWPEAPTAVFLSRYLSHVWVKSHLSESNLSKKRPKKVRIHDIDIYRFTTKVRIWSITALRRRKSA